MRYPENSTKCTKSEREGRKEGRAEDRNFYPVLILYPVSRLFIEERMEVYTADGSSQWQKNVYEFS